MIPPGYTVTRDGRVKGPSGRWCALSLTNGYHKISITVGGTERHVMVGRLVCEAFHGAPPTPAHVAQHIDGNPLNDHAENLRWATRDDIQRGQGAGEEKPHIQGERHPAAVLTWKKVRSIRRENIGGDVTRGYLARKYGVSESAVYCIITGKTWKDPDYTPPPLRT